jgi:hypothetical protein
MSICLGGGSGRDDGGDDGGDDAGNNAGKGDGREACRKGGGLLTEDLVAVAAGVGGAVVGTMAAVAAYCRGHFVVILKIFL